jgi:MFS family permease
VIILVFFFVVIPRLRQERYVRYLVLGFLITVISLAILVVAPVRGVLLVTIATILEAFGAALLAPYLEGFITTAVDPHHRARILAVANTFVLLVASPSGWIAGVLSEQNKAYPFVFAAVMLVVAVLVLALFNPEHRRTVRGGAHE